MWLRTVLVEYEYTGFELIEYTQHISELNDLESAVGNHDKDAGLLDAMHEPGSSPDLDPDLQPWLSL